MSNKNKKATVYDTEPQKANTGFMNLCKRSRYYQACIDVNLLEPGDVAFAKLNDVFIIFISPFDLFKQGKYMYTFRMRCDEDTDLILPDGVVHMYLNASGPDSSNVSPELIELLDYFVHTDTISTDELSSGKVKKLATQVAAIKANQEVGVKYMQEWEERYYERMEAKAEGITKGEQLQIIRQVLKKVDRFPAEVIADMLEEDKDIIQSIIDVHTTAPEADEKEIWNVLYGDDDDDEDDDDDDNDSDNDSGESSNNDLTNNLDDRSDDY